jgi:hypothetical protein
MPRQPRLYIPGALHYVMGRGIERGKIFRMDGDREDFLSRPGEPYRKGSFAFRLRDLKDVAAAVEEVNRMMRVRVTGEFSKKDSEQEET